MIKKILGKIYSAMNRKDGKWTEWYENGQKKSEENWKDGKREGKWTVWYENGQLMEENYYKNGELKDWKITTIRKLID